MAPTMVGQYDEAAASAILEPISVSLHDASIAQLTIVALYVGMPVCHCGAGHLLRVSLSLTTIHRRALIDQWCIQHDGIAVLSLPEGRQDMDQASRRVPMCESSPILPSIELMNRV